MQYSSWRDHIFAGSRNDEIWYAVTTAVVTRQRIGAMRRPVTGSSA
jgi:hypothetical protein